MLHKWKNWIVSSFSIIQSFFSILASFPINSWNFEDIIKFSKCWKLKKNPLFNISMKISTGIYRKIQYSLFTIVLFLWVLLLYCLNINCCLKLIHFIFKNLSPSRHNYIILLCLHFDQFEWFQKVLEEISLYRYFILLIRLGLN